MTYTPLDWDSRFFGFPIGRIDESGLEALRAGVAAADKAGVRCLYFHCPSADQDALDVALDLGFRLYDVRVELECRSLSVDLRPDGVREARADDSAALDGIARERLKGTRFWNDANFDPERVADLYSIWLSRGLSTPSRRTLVGGDADGFITCALDLEGATGEIELIAVAAGAEGRGLGGDLVAAAIADFAAAGLDRATVVTQGSNVAAQRLYQRFGYRTKRVGLWLHRWAS